MSNDKENILSESLNNFSDSDVEEIAENVPALDNRAKKRILEKCMEKMQVTDFDPEITVSGTEKYSRPRLIRYISTCAACLLAVIGIGGMIYINRDMGNPPDDIQSSPQYTAVPTESGTTTQTAESTAKIVTVVTTVGDVIAAVAETDSEPIATVVSDEIISDFAEEDNTETDVETTVSDEVTELPTEIPTPETTTEPVTEPVSENTFVGEYGDKSEIDNGSGSRIEITENGDNLYNVKVKFYRIAYLSDGIGTVSDGVLTFTTGSVEGCPKITAEITLNEDGCLMKIIESEHGYIPPCENVQYYRISE